MIKDEVLSSGKEYSDFIQLEREHKPRENTNMSGSVLGPGMEMYVRVCVVRR